MNRFYSAMVLLVTGLFGAHFVVAQTNPQGDKECVSLVVNHQKRGSDCVGQSGCVTANPPCDGSIRVGGRDYPFLSCDNWQEQEYSACRDKAKETCSQLTTHDPCYEYTGHGANASCTAPSDYRATGEYLSLEHACN